MRNPQESALVSTPQGRARYATAISDGIMTWLNRRDLFAADLATVDDHETWQRDTERQRLQRVLADLARRRNNILRQAQDGDPDDPSTQGLRQTYNNLEAERRAALVAVAKLDAADNAAPEWPAADDASLLDALPHLVLNLADAPQDLLRCLFEITNLAIRLHDDTDDVTISIRLPADEPPAITQAAEKIINTTPTTQALPTQQASPCADAVRAPGRNRTCDTRFRKSRVPGPYTCYQGLRFAIRRTTALGRHDLPHFAPRFAPRGGSFAGCCMPGCPTVGDGLRPTVTIATIADNCLETLRWPFSCGLSCWMPDTAIARSGKGVAESLSHRADADGGWRARSFDEQGGWWTDDVIEPHRVRKIHWSCGYLWRRRGPCSTMV